MEFILMSPEKLKVILQCNDMEEMGVAWDDLDYSNPTTRHFLVDLLDRGYAETGFHPQNARLFIEVFPTDSGGCVLYFTCMPQEQTGFALQDTVPGSGAVVFSFPDADALIEAAVQVYRQCNHRIYRSSCYRMPDGYRLVIYPLDYADRRSILLLGEFADCTGEGEILAAFLEEHGRLLLRDTALDALSFYFGNRADGR